MFGFVFRCNVILELYGELNLWKPSPGLDGISPSGPPTGQNVAVLALTAAGAAPHNT
ncbi:hypothetical protein RRG08_058914, partial [Elysia crispata]